MVTTRENVVDLLRERGEHDQAVQATCVLPTQVDTVRDAGLLHRFGVDAAELVDAH
jgi:hypothetical protein